VPSYIPLPVEELLVYLENITLPSVEFKIIDVEATPEYLVLVLEHVGSLSLIFDRETPSINFVLPYGASGIDILVKVAELGHSYTYEPLPVHVEHIKGGHDIWLPKPWEEYMASVLLPGEKLEKLELKIKYALHGRVTIEVPRDKIVVDIRE